MTGQITVRPIWWVNITSVCFHFSEKKKITDVVFYAQCKKMNHKYLIRGFNNNLSSQHVWIE